MSYIVVYMYIYRVIGRSASREDGLSGGPKVGRMDSRAGGPTDGRTAKRTVGQTDGRADGCRVGRTDGGAGGRSGGQTDDQADGREDDWTLERLMDGRAYAWTRGRAPCPFGAVTGLVIFPRHGICIYIHIYIYTKVSKALVPYGHHHET